MLEALFSYSGRIGRAGFIRWSALQAGLSALVLTVLEGFSHDTTAALRSGTSLDAGAPNIGAMLVLGIALVVFPSSALIIKRLRDVGLPAWPSFGLIAAVDALISGIVPHNANFSQGPFAGLAFQILMTVVLAFVPGKGAYAAAEDRPVDWVERAVEAETRLLADRRRQTVPDAEAALFNQLQSLEALRRQGAGTAAGVDGDATDGVRSGFGRRRTDRY